MPLAIATVWSGEVFVTVTAPVAPLTLIPVPATAEVTPLLVTVTVAPSEPPPETDIPVPAVRSET